MLNQSVTCGLLDYILLKNYHNVLIAIYWCDNPSSGDLIIFAAALCMSVTDTVIR